MYIKIFQIEQTNDEEYMLYILLKQLKKAREKEALDSNLYTLVYKGYLDFTSECDLISTFNASPPPDYHGRPLCVGDVIQVVDRRHPGSFYFIDIDGYIPVHFEAGEARISPTLDEGLTEPEYPITATMQFSLLASDIDYIIGTMLEKPNTSWCLRAAIKDELLESSKEEQITLGGSIRFYTIDDGQHFDLTLEKFLSGVRLWLESSPDYGVSRGGYLDIWDIGSEDADRILQYALFGEIKYGEEVIP